jgi:hypothetical protein
MRLHEILSAANNALSAPGEAALQTAMASAALGILIQEAKRVMAEAAEGEP